MCWLGGGWERSRTRPRGCPGNALPTVSLTLGFRHCVTQPVFLPQASPLLARLPDFSVLCLAPEPASHPHARPLISQSLSSSRCISPTRLFAWQTIVVVPAMSRPWPPVHRLYLAAVL